MSPGSNRRRPPVPPLAPAGGTRRLGAGPAALGRAVGSRSINGHGAHSVRSVVRYDLMQMKEILERLLAGEFTVAEAQRALEANQVEQVDDLARLDPGRMARKGVPEVILASGKTPELCARLALRLVETSGVALVSRVTESHDIALRAAAGGLEFEVFGSGRRLRRGAAPAPSTGAIGVLVAGVAKSHDIALRAAAGGWEFEFFGSGRRLRRGPAPEPSTGAIGVLAAGTSDVDVAEEARMVAESMDVRVLRAYDVGISAVHRLAEPLAAMVRAGIDAGGGVGGGGGR